MALLSTLPGDVPGLMRDGSILRHNGRRAVAVQVTEGFVLVAHHASGADEEIEIEGGTVPWDLVALDLTDPTGRAHAAAWVYHHAKFCVFTNTASVEDHGIWRKALYFAPLDAEEIDTLARLVLRLAGRTV